MEDSNNHIPREECGIVGLYNIPDAANMAYLGAYALQHRGQESAGIVTSNGSRLTRYAGMGKVTEVFSTDILRELKGSLAIAHNRYSTTGASFLGNAQPLRFESRLGTFALAHNGNLTNAHVLRKQLEREGSIFQTTVDSEVISHLMVKSGESDFTNALIYALRKIKGAFSLVIMNENTLYALRDPNGFRPLVMGKKEDGFAFASESCALDIIDAEFTRDVKPGELIRIKDGVVESMFPFEEVRESLCIFEFIYFARPDSQIFRKSVYEVRLQLGRNLAKEHPADADIVIAVPDSSVAAAIGFAEESGIPYQAGLIRSHYIGRTFIEPDQRIRDFGARIKYNPIPFVVSGKRVVVVDDSIMRGTTQKKIVGMLRRAGAKEIHVRISAAPTRHACYYGIDIPSPTELIASAHSVEQITSFLRVDSMGYLSEEGMISAAGTERVYCTACFNGRYPVPLEELQGVPYSNKKEQDE